MLKTGNPGAAPDGSSSSWEEPAFSEHEFNRASGIVRRLQSRIVKAMQMGKPRKAKALQFFLTRSRSGKILAVMRVTENKGKKTPGVDGVTWTTSRQKRNAVDTLRQRGYKPLPLRRVYIPKKNGNLRPLGIPTMRDRAMQALYLLALDPIAETVADPHSYGFRPARSCADALEQVHKVLAGSNRARWVLEGDIRACFDQINHDWLLDHIPMERSILRKWLKAGYLEHANWRPTEAGTPQGGIISPVLANLALDGLQTRLLQAFPKARQPQKKVNLVRYADDFVITGCSREVLEQEVRPLVEQFLAERGLVLSPEKTIITHVDAGLDFLGQNIRRYGKKVLTKPSAQAVKLFYQKLRQVVRKHPHLDPARLIQMLNPKIRGWSNYHRHGSSKATFARLDSLIFRLLWQWAKRRHPKKHRRWLASRYFTTVGGNHWVFYGWDHSKRGDQPLLLAIASRTQIIRHKKTPCNLNAYAAQWQPYLELRRSKPSERGYPATRASIGREIAGVQRAAQLSDQRGSA
ncbi:MAG TPA: group II intron reverse transcriptase/maturase [Thermoanaerobaculia bacterium]|nr:group II intron reverse transcriptase/maturase [Thermoanaerobaculia bacterium]